AMPSRRRTAASSGAALQAARAATRSREARLSPLRRGANRPSWPYGWKGDYAQLMDGSKPSDADPLHQRAETRIIAERGERAIDFQPDDLFRPLVVQLAEPAQRFIVVAEGRVDAREEERERVGRRRSQLDDHRTRLIAVARHPVRVTPHRHEVRLGTREIERLFRQRYRVVHPMLLECDLRAQRVRVREMIVEIDCPLRLLLRFDETSRVEERPADVPARRNRQRIE